MVNDFLHIKVKPSRPTAEAAPTVVPFGIVVLFGLSPIVSLDMMIAADSTVAIATVVGWLRGWVLVPELGTFCVGFITPALLGFPSQFCFTLGLVGYAAVWRISHRHSGVPAWLAVGAIKPPVALLAAASLLLSGVALVAWFVAIRPNIDDIVRTFVPDWPLAALILGGLFFSMFNAALEEVAYRGIVMHALESIMGAGILSLVGQSLAFGLLHINGFPRGWSGVALAIVFGVLMGLIRRRSGGLLACWITHVCTDVIIVGLVVVLART